MFNHSSLIQTLFSPRCPSTVQSRIISVGIYSFESSIFSSVFLFMSKITSIHIGMKFLKIFPQNANPSFTIYLIKFIFRILTSIYHIMINRIKSCMSKSVSKIRWMIYRITSTRFYSSIFNIIKKGFEFFSARTFYQNNSLRSFIFPQNLFDKNFSISFTNTIYSFHI